MAFLAPITAEVGGWALRRMLPWILFVFALLALGAAFWVQTTRLHAVRLQVQADEAQLRLVGEDARRWQAASDQRDQIIHQQAEQLVRLRADAATAQKIADNLEASRQGQIAERDRELQQLKEKAHAHPDQVRPLGPLVVDVLNGMRRGAIEQTGAAAASH